MDQFASIHGMADHAIFLDCKTLDHSYVSLPPDTCIVIADTRKPRALAASDYNNRRKEVDEALGALREALPHIESLRDVTFDELAEHGARLSPESLRRAQHVVTEILRVCDAYDALKASDWALFGNLMRASHESSRDLYQSSIPELDVLWEIACSHPGCLGSRLTGAGFGGATVSIVELDAVADFRDRMISGYFQRTGIAARVDVMTASGGASRIR